MTTSNSTILITGAAGGLGSALAKSWASGGGQLFLLDKDSRGLDRLSDEICAAGCAEPAICPLDLSVADIDAFMEVAAILKRELGGLDHLVHCAAHFSGLAPLDHVAPDDWHKGMQVNVNATWALTAACLPLLRESARATVTLLMDDEIRSASAYWGAYGVSKAALASYARILGEELQATGIRVLALNPGPMRTQLRATAYLAENPADVPGPAQAAEAIIEAILNG